jgi:hypothetical protein
MHTKSQLENFEGRDDLGDLGIEVWVISKWVLGESDVRLLDWILLFEDKVQWRLL